MENDLSYLKEIYERGEMFDPLNPSEDQKRKQKEIEAKEQNKSKLNIYKRTVYMQTEITISMLDKMLRLRSTSVDAESEQNKDLSSISSEESVDITKK